MVTTQKFFPPSEGWGGGWTPQGLSGVVLMLGGGWGEVFAYWPLGSLTFTYLTQLCLWLWGNSSLSGQRHTPNVNPLIGSNNKSSPPPTWSVDRKP